MSSAQKGRAREWRSRDLLEREGYEVVRAAGSKGVFDLVGFRKDEIVLVQVKTRDWPGTEEMADLARFPVPPGVRKLVHRWRLRVRLPDVRELDGDGPEDTF